MKKSIFTTLLLVPLCLNLFAQIKKPQVKPTPAKAAVVPAIASFNLSLTKGKAVYTNNCLHCHLADGGGISNLNPPLSKTTRVIGEKSKLINVLLKGMNEEIEINGNRYSNPMPAQNFLTDQQIADVLTYIRNNFGNKASAVTSIEVRSHRK